MNGVTNGAAAWLSRTPLRAAYAATGLLVLVACAVNVPTRLHDAGPRLAAWRVVTWETTSFIGVMASLWIVFLAMRAAPVPTARWPRGLVVHALAATGFSALHCLAMWTLRRVVYTLAGVAYGWTIAPGQVFYEYRKDMVTYLVAASIYGVMVRLRAGDRVPAAPEPQAAPDWRAPAVLDIRDGAKLVRAPVADIVAAEAAGNYVTILLRNGDRPLMRTTLTALEATLAPQGFLRVHRGWLVNRAHVRVVEPTGAGDYRLELACGVTAPLSRRYPAAVRALREGYVFKGPVMSSGRTQASN